MALLRFDQFQQQRLYGPDGFYATGGAAGSGADFMTAPELSVEFSAALGVEMDELWNRLGRPHPFVVVEGGAGVGTLARDCLLLDLECSAALRWVMVEISDLQRATAMARVLSELPVDGANETAPLSAIADLGRARFTTDVHLVVANELLDNLPVRIVRIIDHNVSEMVVDVVGDRATPSWVRADDPVSQRALHHGRDVTPGVEFPLADQMALWVHRARSLVVSGGRVIIMDYGANTAELAQRPHRGWLRTYDRHRRGSDPFDLARSVDITSDVPFDQLGAGAHSTSQAEWVLRRRPQAADRRDPGTVALLDPHGVGGFRVLTWDQP